MERQIGKVYVVKPRSVPPDLVFQFHQASWVSPTPHDLRIDRRIDLPYGNITFISAYALGDPQTGERLIDIGAAGLTSLVRAPFSALSPNEFRFPSKHVDQNVRHVSGELLKSCRVLAMSQEMYHFLSGKSIPCFETPALAQAHIASLWSPIKQKIPFKCESCNKFLWLDIAKIPTKPTRARCPACTQLLSIETPKGMVAKLDDAFSGGQDRPAMAELQAPPREDAFFPDVGIAWDTPSAQAASPTRVETPPATPAGKAPAPFDFEVDLDAILSGVTAAPTPSVPTPKLQSRQTADSSEVVEAPAAHGAAPDIQLDDDFFNEIMPDAKQAQPALSARSAPPPPPSTVTPPAPSREPARPPVEKSGYADVFERADSQVAGASGATGRQCHVCGSEVGDERVCPSCLAEQTLGGVAMDELVAPDSGVEIRLKGASGHDHGAKGPLSSAVSPAPGDLPGIPATPDEGAAEEKVSTVPYWEEKVWSVKVGDELYPDLNMLMIEEWVLDHTLMEADLVKKGETKWVELRAVPYFRGALSKVKEGIRLGSPTNPVYFKPAPSATRLAAFFIDVPFMALCGAAGWFAMGFAVSDASFPAKAFSVYLFVFLYLSIGNGALGRSVGKSIQHIGVVNKLGHPIGFPKGAIRALVWTFTFFMAPKAASNPHHQAFHDKVADSYVVVMD